MQGEYIVEILIGKNRIHQWIIKAGRENGSYRDSRYVGDAPIEPTDKYTAE